MSNSRRPASRMATVLVVDDEVRSQEARRRTLDEEFEVFTASSAEEAQKILEQEPVQILLCDQRMPGESGVSFLKRVRSQWPDVVRIIISGYTDSEDIIAGINEAGIYQYLLKPWQPDALFRSIRNAAELYRLQAENQRLSLELRTTSPVLRRRVEMKYERVKREFGLDGLTRAADSRLNPVCELIAQVAPFDLSVLISGEWATGKEMIARAIHYQSRRADKSFVVENCGALPDQLLEAELFGYKRGAFTGAYEDRVGLFQQADGGTIFLDEIGETSPAFQVKLLRVLQEGEFRPLGSNRPVSVDVRVLAATNRDLEEDVRTGRFREDLYYRLTTISLHVPPLRERGTDLPLLARQLLANSGAALGKRADDFSAEALACLAAYRWPGNVRELQNEILRLVALTESPRIGAELLSPRILRTPIGDAAPPDIVWPEGQAPLSGNLKERMDHLEMQVLKEAMIRHRWNKSRAARELGLSRVGLRAKLVRYGLERGD